jgi:hypothetical protein
VEAAAMDVGVLRDFVIVIGGLLLLVLILVAGILAFLLYRQFKSLTASLKNTIALSRETASELKQTINTAKDLVSVFKGSKEKTPTPPPPGSPN